MITVKGDITSLGSMGAVNVIVHSVNAQGKIGFGTAGSIIRKWPGVRDDYLTHYRTGNMRTGDVVTTQVAEDLYVCSVVAQEFYRGSFSGSNRTQDMLDYDGIAIALDKVSKHFSSGKVNYHFTTFGGGFANGDWCRVQSLFLEKLSTANQLVHWDLPEGRKQVKGF